MAEVSKNIKKIRNELGMTQQELADRLNVTRQAVSSWETGKNHPDLDMLEKIAQIYGVGLEELIYGRKKPKQQIDRKRRIMRAAVFGMIFAALVVLGRCLEPVVQDRLMRQYDGYSMMLFSTVLIPAIYVSAGITGMAVASVFYNICLRSRRQRIISGIAAAVIVLILEALSWSWPYCDIGYFVMDILNDAQAVYVLPGILFFLAGERREIC